MLREPSGRAVKHYMAYTTPDPIPNRIRLTAGRAYKSDAMNNSFQAPIGSCESPPGRAARFDPENSVPSVSLVLNFTFWGVFWLLSSVPLVF